jgi:NADPH-dependent curcumin reductase CurA
VIASRHDQFTLGDWVHGAFGVQEHAVSDGQGAHKLEVNERLTPAAYLGVLGLTVLTAYFVLLDIGRPVEGQPVLVSGAARGVGLAVGQIAKLKGAPAVGIAGGPEKRRMLVEELGFDGAIDYKRGDLLDQLREHTPEADGVEPVGRRVDTAPSEGRADVL